MNDKPELQATDSPSRGREILTEQDNLSTADLVREANASKQSFGKDGDAAPPARMPLLSAEESRKLCSSWDAIQSSFVDEPKSAVARADRLVAGAIKQLAEVFAAERSKLEHQWERGEDVSTEELRVTLQRYRSFFQRVVSV